MSIKKCLVISIIAFALWLALAFKAKADSSQLLNEYIGKLIVCESRENPAAFNDNDGKEGLHSYGILQFQIPTIWYYNQKYKVLPDIEYAEIENVIWDTWVQWEFAEKILQEPYGYLNWKNCTTNPTQPGYVGLPPQWL